MNYRYSSKYCRAESITTFIIRPLPGLLGILGVDHKQAKPWFTNDTRVIMQSSSIALSDAMNTELQ